MKDNLQIISAAIGQCGRIRGCEQAPEVMQCLHPEWPWKTTINFESDAGNLEALPELINFSHRLAKVIGECVKGQEQFCVIGGDNACSIGTWSGVADALEGDLGLIWIDAHMDSHTPETSPTLNLHGMPVASLLGYGDEKLARIANIHPVLKPQNLVMIGMRSYEKEEQALLEKLQVKIFYIDEVLNRGFAEVMQDAHQLISRSTSAYGVMIDLDAFDPKECAAVDTPERRGIHAQDVINTLEKLDKKKLAGIELTEFNPLLRIQHETEKTISALVSACFN